MAKYPTCIIISDSKTPENKLVKALIKRGVSRFSITYSPAHGYSFSENLDGSARNIWVDGSFLGFTQASALKNIKNAIIEGNILNLHKSISNE